MKKLLLPLLFLTTLSLSAEVIHEQKWDASFTTKEVIFNNRRLEKVASQEKTPDGDAVLALRVIEKPDNTPHGAQLNLFCDANLKKGDKLRISFWIKGSEYGTIQFNFIQHGKPWKGISRRSIGSVKVRPEWQKVTYELTVEQDHQEPIRFPMFMLGAYPLNATLLLGPVRTEKIQNHLPLALRESWMLYPGVTPESLDWNALDPLPVSIGGAKGIPVTFRNNALDLESVAGRAAEGKPALLLNQFSAGSDGFMQLGVGADWWFDFLVNGKSIYDTLKTGNTVTPAGVTNHVFNFPVRKGKNTVALFVKSGSEGWKVFCGAVPFREKLDNVTTILRAPEWRPIKMDPVEWVYVQPRRIPMLDVKPGTALDLSGFLDRAPKIGELGRIIVNQEGKLAYEKEPSRTVRFRSFTIDPGAWQNRLYAMSKPEIEEYAEAIRLRGFNMVRIQAPDGALTGKNGYPKKPITLREATLPRTMEELPIDKTFADRWDYFVACLRKRNIYLLPDIASTRTSWTAATVEFDVKTGLLFREDYRENWRAGFHYMMKHRNPYTGMTWAEDPALYIVSFTNENNLYAKLLAEPGIAEQYRKLYPKWMKEHYPSENSGEPNLGNRRFQEFLYTLQHQSILEQARFLKEELGLQALQTDVNMDCKIPLALIRNDLDTVDDHKYQDHPRFPVKPWELPGLYRQRSSISALGSEVPEQLFAARLFGKPFSITEYKFCVPNQFRSEGGPLIGGYAALQGWDALYQFAWSHSDWAVKQDIPLGNFDFANEPLSWLSDRLVMLLFRRGDVSPSKERFAWNVPKNFWNSDMPLEYPLDFSRLGLIAGVGTVVDNRQVPGVQVISANEAAGKAPLPDRKIQALRQTLLRTGVAESSTGELRLDSRKNTLAIQTPRTLSATLASGNLTAGALTVRQVTYPTTVSVSSLDDAPVARSGKLLLFHLTNVIDSGTTFKGEKMQYLLKWGKLPHLVRRAPAKVSLRLDGDTVPKVEALHFDGTVRGEVKSTFANGVLSFTADPGCFPGGVMVYWITRDTKPGV